MGKPYSRKEGNFKSVLTGGCWHAEAVGRLTRRVYTLYLDRPAYLVFSIRIKMETGQILGKQPITNRVLFTWS